MFKYIIIQRNLGDPFSVYFIHFVIEGMIIYNDVLAVSFLILCNILLKA
jgi:hypothetical protein